MSSVANDPITAHGGGELVDLKAPAAEQAGLRAHAEKLPVVTLGARELADLEIPDLLREALQIFGVASWEVVEGRWTSDHDPLLPWGRQLVEIDL